MAEYVRLVRRDLHTATHRYTHADTGRQVTVIGMHHVGEPAYFAQLRAIIDELEAAGAVVQCEGSRLLPCNDPDITAEERNLIDTLRHANDLEQRRLLDLGWVGQIDGLGYPPRWQIIDLSYLQLIRQIGPARLQRIATRKTKALDWPDGDRRAADRMRAGVAVMLRLTATDRSVTRSARRRPAAAVLVDRRTAVALDGVFGTDRDVVLVWGVGHLPGLGAGLRAKGFVRTDPPQWHTVARLPSIRSALWQLAVGRWRPASRRHPPITGDPHAVPLRRSGHRLALPLVTGLSAYLVLVGAATYRLTDHLATLKIGQRITAAIPQRDQPLSPLELTGEADCTTAGRWAVRWTLASRAEHLRYRIERRTVSPGGTVTGLRPGATVAPGATLTGRHLPPPGSTRVAMTIVVQPAVGSVAPEKTLTASATAPSCATPLPPITHAPSRPAGGTPRRPTGKPRPSGIAAPAHHDPLPAHPGPAGARP